MNSSVSYGVITILSRSFSTVSLFRYNAVSNTMSASISVGSDGYLNFHPYNSDWELSKFKDSQATMKYEHRTILKMEEDE